jgi:hypothetical protein
VLRVRNRSASVVRTLTFDDATDLDLRMAAAQKPKSQAAAQPAKGAPLGDLKVPAVFR